MGESRADFTTRAQLDAAVLAVIADMLSSPENWGRVVIAERENLLPVLDAAPPKRFGLFARKPLVASARVVQAQLDGRGTGTIEVLQGAVVEGRTPPGVEEHLRRLGYDDGVPAGHPGEAWGLPVTETTARCIADAILTAVNVLGLEPAEVELTRVD